jgi:hypothetical protein
LEEQQVRERMENLREELGNLDARLQAIRREQERLPRLRAVHTGFRLLPTAAPAQGVPVTVALTSTMPERPTNPLELLRRSPHGTLLFTPEQGEMDEAEMALCIRAPSDRIAQLGPSPPVEFRAGIFTLAEPGPAVIPVLVRVGPEEAEGLYEGWIDEAFPGRDRALERLATQQGITLCFYGDACRLERTLKVSNPLRAFAKEALGVVAGRPPVTGDALHQARQLVYKRFASLGSLWRALKS